MVWGAVGLLVVAGILWFSLARRGIEVQGLVPFPAPAPAVAQAGPEFLDFVGSSTCGECHATKYEAWRSSTHGRAGGPPNRETIIAPFDGRPIQFADATVVPTVNDAGEYLFTIRQTQRAPASLRVDGVIGGGHMVGGGTQGFVSQFPDGTVRFLPFDYSRTNDLWFCNSGTRTSEGWVSITPDMRLADCGDWPPNRVLGAEARFSNCQECHGSQIHLSYDASVGAYRTDIKSLSINCESCHGPGKEHVERARTGALGQGAELALRSFGTEDKDASLEVCFQCHALKDALERGYLPGKPLQRHYSLKGSLIGDDPLFPDGRVRTFAYQQNHLYSDCYLNGSMTCVDCHDPHGQGYRDVFGAPLPSRFSDGQCTSCHPSKADDVTRHTKHAPDSPGSQCVSCHMPYLQHPELGDQVRFARSDHSIPIPRAGFDETLGVQSACGACHADRSVAELEAQTRSWYGELKPHKDVIAALLAVEQDPDLPPIARLVEASDDHTIAQVAIVDALMERYLEPNVEVLEPEVVAALQGMAGHSDLDVRAAGMAALHFARGNDPDVRIFLIEQLLALGEMDAAVRKRWVVTLGTFADAYRDRGEFGHAFVAYNKALEVLPDDPAVHLNLGLAYYGARDFQRAVNVLTRATEIDPAHPSVWVNLGLAYEAQNLEAEAEAAYHRALRENPREALAFFNLGNQRLRREDAAGAIEYYRQAVAVDPGLGRAHFYLARAYIVVGDLTNALRSARYAVEFEPENASAREMLRDLETAERD